MIKLKKLLVPTGETKKVDAIEVWTVSWWSRYNEYSFGVNKEFEVFISEGEAEDFAKSLRDAFKLLRYTSGTKITVDKNK